MAKRAASAYMTTLERILGGVHFCIYLLVLPFVTGPLFALLERLLGSPIPDNVQNMIYYYVLFAVTVVIFWNYLGRTTGYFLSAPWRTVGTALMGLVAFYGLNELAYRLLGLVLDGMTNLNDVAISAQVRDAPRSTALIVVFLAPFVEEVLFRGYVFGNLRDHSRWAAYAASCLLFALLHVWQFAVVEQNLQYFLLMFQYLVPGLVLAWTYERSGTLWSSVILHAFVNAMAIGRFL